LSQRPQRELWKNTKNYFFKSYKWLYPGLCPESFLFQTSFNIPEHYFQTFYYSFPNPWPYDWILSKITKYIFFVNSSSKNWRLFTSYHFLFEKKISTFIRGDLIMVLWGLFNQTAKIRVKSCIEKLLSIFWWFFVDYFL
jgi:hypothetical protein